MFQDCVYVCMYITWWRKRNPLPKLYAFDRVRQCGKLNICSTSKFIPVETRSLSVRCSVSQKTWERIATFILCRLRMEFPWHKISFKCKKRNVWSELHMSWINGRGLLNLISVWNGKCFRCFSLEKPQMLVSVLEFHLKEQGVFSTHSR